MPGFGPLLGAEFLAATGGDVSTFGTADRSWRASPVWRRCREIRAESVEICAGRADMTAGCCAPSICRRNRSIRHTAQSQVFYDRKRAEGKRHTQAVLALARRRLNVLWAMLRDQSPYRPPAVEAVGGRKGRLAISTSA